MVQMKTIRSRSGMTRLWVAGMAVSMVGGVAWAQAEDLPKAEKILDRYVEVTGGEAAYKKLKNQTMEGGFEIAAQGLKFDMKGKSAHPNKLVVEMSSEAMGTITKGTDGTAAWEITQMTGPRLIEGPELAEFMRQATFNAPLHWRKMYSSVETLGVEEVDGKTCYKVQLTPNEGKPETQYYDKDSGLLIKQESIAATQMGEMPITSFYSEHKEFDGIKVATVTTQSFAGMEVKITLTKLENNVDLDENVFAMPKEVKELQADVSAEETPEMGDPEEGE